MAKEFLKKLIIITLSSPAAAYGIALALYAGCHIYGENEWASFLIMPAGVVLFAAGTGLYASAFLERGSYEAVSFAI